MEINCFCVFKADKGSSFEMKDRAARRLCIIFVKLQKFPVFLSNVVS